MKTKLLILGAGGHGHVVADAAVASNRWSSVAFLDDRFPELKRAAQWAVVDVIGNAKKWKHEYPQAVVAVGDNETRLQLSLQLELLGFDLVSVIHPSAAISTSSNIAKGSVMLANSVVNIGGSLGKASIVNTGAIVDHDCVIGEAVHISPGCNLAGAVSVGNNSWLGIGSSYLPGIVIGKYCTIGAGAVVLTDIPDNCTAVGIPAKIIS
ncbi:MAG: acetyltransferase [Motiliproteus sp.]